jgi:maltokinase
LSTPAPNGVHAWRQPGEQSARALLELIESDAPDPAGFRITRAASRPIEPLFENWSVRPIEVDQTNESWVVGEAVVIKWITEDVDGPHPAGDRLRRLAAAGFARTPRLWGMVERQTTSKAWVPVAIVVDYVADAEDGWTWCVREAATALRAPGVLDALAIAPMPPRLFARDLGTLTGEMHRALADRPVPGSSDPTLVHGHGDYHVGQVLRVPSGRLFVVDFDGNPTLTPRERCLPRPAAYDVAGMLLSLENVGHVVCHHAPVSDDDAAAWTGSVQRTFLDAYLGLADDLLDTSLIEPMMLAQIERELDYARAFLPRWQYVPEAALRRRGMS